MSAAGFVGQDNSFLCNNSDISQRDTPELGWHARSLALRDGEEQLVVLATVKGKL